MNGNPAIVMSLLVIAGWSVFCGLVGILVYEVSSDVVRWVRSRSKRKR